MDVVMYPLLKQTDYTELRYSLRSLKYIPEVTEVVIVGDRLPEWIVNVTHINLGDIKGRKQLSIRRKILAALEYCEQFLFMNDDVYLLEPLTFKYYWHTHLINHTSESGAKILMKELAEFNLPVKDFDGHYPLVYDRMFLEVSEQFSSDTIIKSMYCNYLKIPGEHILDCKMVGRNKKFPSHLPCASTGTYSLKNALPILEQLFPNPSIYEL